MTPVQFFAVVFLRLFCLVCLCLGLVAHALDHITMPATLPEKSSMETALSETTRLLLQNKASAHARDALGRTASRHAKLAGYDLPQLEQCTVLWRMF